MNPIILYYSRSGKTEKLARRISDDLKCEMLIVEPEKAYGNYLSAVIRVIREKSKQPPPGFITGIPDLASYDVVFLGFPIWASDMPVFFAEFVNQCDLQGKTIIPFATFGRTDISCAANTLARICKGAEIKLPFNYGMSKKDDYNNWIGDLQ